MGYLHKGHISLIRRSKKKADITIVSVFVNPSQFAPNEDLEKYPRDLKRDKNLLEKERVDILFCPDVSEIYQENFQSYIEVSGISQKYEGQFRPSHFRGVATVVSILFNCVKPDFVFFGQKDAQQAVVVQRMIEDLKFDLKMVICPIIREEDGLALSSRNVYLSRQERKDALVLNNSLKLAAKMIKDGARESSGILSEMERLICSIQSANLDYVKIVHCDSFTEVKSLEEGVKYYILVACRIGKTRLIDNQLIKV